MMQRACITPKRRLANATVAPVFNPIPGASNGPKYVLLISVSIHEIYIYIHIHIYIYLVYIDKSVCICIYVYIYIFIHTLLYLHLHLCLHLYFFLRPQEVGIHIYIYMCMHASPRVLSSLLCYALPWRPNPGVLGTKLQGLLENRICLAS